MQNLINTTANRFLETLLRIIVQLSVLRDIVMNSFFRVVKRLYAERTAQPRYDVWK